MTRTDTDRAPEGKARSGDAAFLTLPAADGDGVARCGGDWVVDHAAHIDRLIRDGGAAGLRVESLDLSGIGRMDTTGALLVRRAIMMLGGKGDPALVGTRNTHQALLNVVKQCPPPTRVDADDLPPLLQPVADLGDLTFRGYRSLGGAVGFVGLILARLARMLLHPGRFRFIATVNQMEMTGVRAMGIVGLISFLIGSVMVNQGAVQLQRFGADILVVDMLGISLFRELGILLTAIMIAGRSGSAFTAEIGSMSLREEVDAMRTIGMDPVEVLVLPRFLALLVVLPLLTVFANVMGVFGGALMAWWQLDIQPANFLVYFQDAVAVEHFLVGMIKAPFFGAIIAVTGCYQGLRVSGSADALGRHTTRSVVQAIFYVIVLDALFAVFFTAVGL
ncbi:MlaE family ABC transporter permease [Yunchengibacter salinarum]|uniref:MlaE family ABC transporter permease n=1 Tax=Yunchengibacter salinarum TaxID=3133399 RepID=UPI0035B5F217